MWRKRIPFATQMLQTVSTLIEQYPATTVVAYVSLIVEVKIENSLFLKRKKHF